MRQVAIDIGLVFVIDNPVRYTCDIYVRRLFFFHLPFSHLQSRLLDAFGEAR